MNVYTKWLIKADLPSVLVVEAGCDYPWTEEQIIEVLRHKNCVGLVAVDANENVVGYTIYELAKGFLHVIKLAVHPKYRHQGVGGFIVRKLTQKLQSQNRTELVATVVETNLAACAFLRSQGFRAQTPLIKDVPEYDDRDCIQFRYTRAGVKEFRVNRITEYMGAD
jgi:ribosomal protein S18 acetylase RimI-like enzyme